MSKGQTIDYANCELRKDTQLAGQVDAALSIAALDGIGRVLDYMQHHGVHHHVAITGCARRRTVIANTQMTERAGRPRVPPAGVSNRSPSVPPTQRQDLAGGGHFPANSPTRLPCQRCPAHAWRISQATIATTSAEPT